MATAAVDSCNSGPRLILKHTFLEYVGVDSSPREKIVRSRPRTLTDSMTSWSIQEIKETKNSSLAINCPTPETTTPALSDAGEGSPCSESTDYANEDVLSTVPCSTREGANLLLSPAWSPWRRPDEFADMEASSFGLLPPASWCENPGGILQAPFACEATQFCMAYEWINRWGCSFNSELVSCEDSASLPSKLPAGEVTFGDPSVSIAVHDEESTAQKMVQAWHSDERISVWADVQDGPSDDHISDGLKTTVMLRQLPAGFTRTMMIELIESEGFSRRFDFVYVPVDFSTGLALGYGFVNLVSPAVARAFMHHFAGFAKWKIASDAICQVCWGEPCQGLSQHLERYRNSPVMHNSVEDEWKPVFYVEGARAAFPSPTKHIKAPKIRKRRD